MSTTETPKPNPFTRPRFIAAATVVGMVALAALIMSLIVHFDQDGEGRDLSIPACERPASSDTDYSGALTVDRWQTVGAAALPATPFGPSEIEDTPGCFEHSPAGAVTAAVYVATLGSSGDIRMVLEDMSVDSPNTEAFLAEVSGAEQATPIRPAGLRLADYSGDAATVSVVFDHQGRHPVVTIDLLWEDGDWKWNTPSQSLSVTETNTLTGYNRIPQEDPTNG